MYRDKKIIHIVAIGNNGEIGFDNKLLWYIPNDLRFFKETTLGHVVLMGRKTVESLPKPLERRIVISATSMGGRIKLDQWLDWAVDQACPSLNTDCIYIAGGSSIYEQTFKYADELLVTKVERNYLHADTFYKIPDNFKMIEASDYKFHKDLPYCFTKWVNHKTSE